MTANLSRRIKQLEREAKPQLTPEESAEQAERREFFEFIYSGPFVKEFCEKANTLFASMENEHALIVISDCHTLEQWDKGFPYPQENRITEYFFKMLKGAIEGSYVGPLALPATVCEFFREYKNAYSAVYLSGCDCEDCGYLVPTNKWFGYERHYHDRSVPEDYEAMRCPLCDCRARPGAFHKKHPDKFPGRFNHRELDEIRAARFPQFVKRILWGCHTYGHFEPKPLMILLARLTTAPETVI
jgi:hypothetical protein